MRSILLCALVLGLLGPGWCAGTYTATIEATAQAVPTVAGAWFDFPAFLKLGGETAAFAPESVVVRPAEPAGADPVASRVEESQGTYRLFWEVPAVAQKDAGQPVTFRVEFGVKPAPGGSPRLPASAVDTLIANGDFEAATDQGVPVGIAPGIFQRDFRRVAEKEGRALAFNADPEGRGPAFITPWVSVRGGDSLAYSFRFRARGAEAHPRYKVILFSYVNYRDAEGKPLPRAHAYTTRLGDTDGWEEVRVTLPVPPAARSTNLEIRNGSQVPYSVSIDDVRIAATTIPQVMAATAPGGQRLSLRVEDENVRRIDLGTATSPVWQGFQALAPEMEYTAERGLGFTRLARPLGLDKVRPDPLARDFITAARADLRIDLPDGEYTLWALIGDSQVGSTILTIYRDQLLQINGQEVLKRDVPPAEFFRTTYLRHYADFWYPGMDFYDTFVAPNFEEHFFPVTVTGGKLTLSWRNVPLAALVVAPKARDAELRAELSRLKAERRRATPIEEVAPPVEEAPAAGVLTAAERKRGFVLFRRPANESIYPTSRPKPEERITALQAFATPGEYEPVHFSLYPLRNLGAVRIRATELRARAGGRIPASAVDVRVVRYHFRAAGGRGVAGAYRYQIAPYILDQRDSVEVTEGTTWSWWASIHVPEDAPAGVYEGALEITAGQEPALRLPVSIRVLPFRLASLPILQGYYYFPSEPWYSTFWGANVRGPDYRDDPEVRKIIIENERRELRFMKSLGLNSVAFGDDLRRDLELVDGKVRLKPDNRFALWMDLYKEAGMGPMPFYGFQPLGAGNLLAWLEREKLKERFTPQWNTAYRSFVEECQRIGKERGWPEILWYISDELSNHGEEGAKLGVELAKALKGMPGVRTIASMNGPWEHIMVPHLNISMPNIAFPITEETVKKVRDSGSELWLYNCGDERLNLGLYPWRVKAGGRFQWHYRYINADPWDDLDGAGADTQYCLSLPGPDGPVPAVKSQMVREAVDDHRYIATLEQAIARARSDAKKQAAVAKATRFLEELRTRIPVDFRTLVGYQVDPRAAGASVGGEFKNTDALDRVRWAVAQLILELQTAGGGATTGKGK